MVGSSVVKVEVVGCLWLTHFPAMGKNLKPNPDSSLGKVFFTLIIYGQQSWYYPNHASLLESWNCRTFNWEPGGFSKRREADGTWEKEDVKLGEDEKMIHFLSHCFLPLSAALHSRPGYQQGHIRLLYMEILMLIDLVTPKEASKTSLRYMWIV